MNTNREKKRRKEGEKTLSVCISDLEGKKRKEKNRKKNE
jgi:hypothetical protein